jgi:hypothetical protein
MCGAVFRMAFGRMSDASSPSSEPGQTGVPDTGCRCAGPSGFLFVDDQFRSFVIPQGPLSPILYPVSWRRQSCRIISRHSAELGEREQDIECQPPHKVDVLNCWVTAAKPDLVEQLRRLGKIG